VDRSTWAAVRSRAELSDLVGQPLPRVRDKARSALHQHDLDWLAVSPFVLVATADASGACDVSPKGDLPGFAMVLDDTTIALPDRPGNRRVDGFANVLQNPHVGLMFLVPARGDTLRINGRASLVRDAPFFDAMTVQGHRPAIAMVVDVDEVFYHCSKAFLRAQLWEPGTWPSPGALPSRARIAQSLERPDERIEDLERYYGPDYAGRLYT